MSVRLAFLFMWMLAVVLPACPARAQEGGGGLSQQQIAAQTQRLIADVRAARNQSVQREEIALAMEDLGRQIRLVDDCIARGSSRGYITTLLSSGGCVVRPIEEVSRAISAEVLEGRFQPEQVTSALFRLSKDSGYFLRYLHNVRNRMAVQFEQLRQRAASPVMPPRPQTELPPLPTAAPAAAATAAATAAAGMGGCMIVRQNSCAYTTQQGCASFGGQFCGVSPTNPCHPVGNQNRC